eukprot:PhM_4_TR8460/c5_g1_i2/m.47262
MEEAASDSQMVGEISGSMQRGDASEVLRVVGIKRNTGVVASDIHQDVPGHVSAPKISRDSDVHSGPQQDRRIDRNATGSPAEDGRCAAPVPEPTAKLQVRAVPRLEDGKPVVGRREVAKKGHMADFGDGACRGISAHEVYSAPPVPSGPVGACSPQDRALAPVHVPVEVAAVIAHNRMDGGASSRCDEKYITGQLTGDTQHQERGSADARNRSSARPSIAECRGPTRETRQHGAADAGPDSAIRQQPGDYGSCARNGKSDGPATFATMRRPPPHIKWGRRGKVATAQEREKIRFHSGKKLTSRIDLDGVQRLAAECDMGAYVADLFGWLRDETRYTPMGLDEIAKAPRSDFTASDIQDQLMAGEISPIDAAHVRAVMKTFTVVEEKFPDLPGPPHFPRAHEAASMHPALRRRGIGWPKHNNNEINYLPQMDIAGLQEQLEQVTAGSWAACADLTKSFSQLELAPEVRRFHCFQDSDGRWYAYNVAVMGSRPSAEIMDAVTKVLAMARQPSTSVTTKTHIDNVRFLAADRSTVQTAMNVFLENCRRVRATVNESGEHSPHTFGTSFGVVHDYHAGLSALNAKQLRRLVALLEQLNAPDWTRKGIFELFGTLFYTSTVLKNPLSRHYYEIKWYRRRAADFEKDNDLWKMESLPSGVRYGLRSWIRELLSNRPVSHERVVPT